MGEPVAHPVTRVLVIDDEPMVGRMISRILRRHYQVIVLTSAEEALSCLAAGEHFDAIVCDYALPGMDGGQFRCSVAQLAPEYVDRILFASGAQLDEDHVSGPWLSKPFTPAALIAAIELRLDHCNDLGSLDRVTREVI